MSDHPRIMTTGQVIEAREMLFELDALERKLAGIEQAIKTKTMPDWDIWRFVDQDLIRETLRLSLKANVEAKREEIAKAGIDLTDWDKRDKAKT